jgi:hypothetical protein
MFNLGIVINGHYANKCPEPPSEGKGKGRKGKGKGDTYERERMAEMAAMDFGEPPEMSEEDKRRAERPWTKDPNVETSRFTRCVFCVR